MIEDEYRPWVKGSFEKDMEILTQEVSDKKKDKLCCVICGKDITRSMKIYMYGYHGGAYCYDCAEAEKVRLKRKKAKTRQIVKNMRKRGLKPTEIADKIGITTKEVYEVLK